jgi:predicted HTH domain antitoxin
MEKLTTEAKTEGKIETLIDLVKDNVLSLAEAAKRAGMSEQKFSDMMKQA